MISLKLISFVLLCLAASFLAARLQLRQDGNKPHVSEINNQLESLGSIAKPTHRGSVAIVGAAGNIGSRLYEFLPTMGFQVTGFDRDPRLDGQIGIVNSSSDGIPDASLKKFDAVIFLGGLTGRNACEIVTEAEVHQENVAAPGALASRMNSDQLFIFASTSAIAEGSGESPHREDDQVNRHLLDRYSLSMLQREESLSKLSLNKNSPKMVGLRFGTVVGVSPGQRADLLYPSLFRSAYTAGNIRVQDGSAFRAFLWLEDLVRSFASILQSKQPLPSSMRFEVFNLESFHTNINRVVNSVSAATRVRVQVLNSGPSKSVGFSLNAHKFSKTFKFAFRGTLEVVTSEMNSHVPDSFTGKGAHQSRKLAIGYTNDADSIPCPVCGSTHLQEVLDLKQQPLANDFRKSADDALTAPRYPLKLMRCKTCNHMHLSNVADRPALFSDYLYQSGTSQTLLEYFDTLARNVIKQFDGKSGTVLEIACNDGSQLDKFKKYGWKTYGVDPAENLAPIAAKKGHQVFVGFWGSQDFPDLPPPSQLDAIIAQNVFAHVGDPVAFLRACARAMGPQTKLYIQTSQCQMHQMGQFDTAYHEHVSFFTGHSFYKAAQLSGLHIIDFDLAPIHGTSCFVTFQVATPQHPASQVSSGLQARLDSEIEDGIPTDFFYMKYGARASNTKDWMADQLIGLKQSGYKIGGYGAAAKGMVLMHSLLQNEKLKDFELSFVLDDAPLKQNRYCAGTRVPVWPTLKVRDVPSDRPLAIVVLAWNFWDELASNLRKLLVGYRKEVLCLIPFPKPRAVRLVIDTTSEKVLVHAPYYPASISKTYKQKTMLISHFFNEEFLLPHWIRHHAHMFDAAVLIDHKSTDASLAIIRREAPPSWKIVSSVNSKFSEDTNHIEVQHYEAMYPDDWVIALDTTEFLVHPSLQSFLQKKSETKIVRFLAASMVGDDSLQFKTNGNLLEQRTVYATSDGTSVTTADNRTPRFPEHLKKSDVSRFMHLNLNTTYRYSSGRHTVLDINNGQPVAIPISEEGFIMKYKKTPWPVVAEHAFDVKNGELEGLSTFDIRDYTKTPSDELAWIHRDYHSAISPAAVPFH